MKTVEQIEKQIEEAERQIKAYSGNRHAQSNVEMARILKASLEQELSKAMEAMKNRYSE